MWGFFLVFFLKTMFMCSVVTVLMLNKKNFFSRNETNIITSFCHHARLHVHDKGQTIKQRKTKNLMNNNFFFFFQLQHLKYLLKKSLFDI